MVWVYLPRRFSVSSSEVWQLTSAHCSYCSPFYPLSFITFPPTNTLMLLSRVYSHHQGMRCKCMHHDVQYSLVGLPHLNSCIYFCHCSVPRWLAWERRCASKVLTEQQQQHKISLLTFTDLTALRPTHTHNNYTKLNTFSQLLRKTIYPVIFMWCNGKLFFFVVVFFSLLLFKLSREPKEETFGVFA